MSRACVTLAGLVSVRHKQTTARTKPHLLAMQHLIKAGFECQKKKGIDSTPQEFMRDNDLHRPHHYRESAF